MAYAMALPGSLERAAAAVGIKQEAGQSRRCGQPAHPQQAGDDEAGDSGQYQLSDPGAVGSQVVAVERGQPGSGDGDQQQPPGVRAGLGAVGLDLAPHGYVLGEASRQLGQHPRQPRPAQLRTQQQGGDDQVPGGVVEVVGEGQQRPGRRPARLQPRGQRRHLCRDRLGRGAGRANQRLLQAAACSQHVGSAAHPLLKRLQPLHRGVAPGELRQQPRHTDDRQPGQHASDRPARGHPHHRRRNGGGHPQRPLPPHRRAVGPRRRTRLAAPRPSRRFGGGEGVGGQQQAAYQQHPADAGQQSRAAHRRPPTAPAQRPGRSQLGSKPTRM